MPRTTLNIDASVLRDLKRRSALPVLVLTSRDQLRDEVHALELGADEYLTKPYRKERLLARITRKSAEALQIAAGTTVYAQIKGVALAPRRGVGE